MSNRLTHYFIGFSLLPFFIGSLLVPGLVYAEEISLQSISVRARLSEKTLLGEDAPEDFKDYEFSANFKLPWKREITSGWQMGTRFMASAGLLRGAGKDALVVALIPELTLGSENGRFTMDVGAGGALFSRHRFGTQDFGGSFQFALTLGLVVPVYKNLQMGYRFMHYSDAGLHGSDTTGADFHMIEFSYRL